MRTPFVTCSPFSRTSRIGQPGGADDPAGSEAGQYNYRQSGGRGVGAGGEEAHAAANVPADAQRARDEAVPPWRRRNARIILRGRGIERHPSDDGQHEQDTRLLFDQGWGQGADPVVKGWTRDN